MTTQTHQELVNFIWSICNLLRGPYKRNEYRKVILPMTVLRRFDCLLAPTKDAVLARHEKCRTRSDTVIHSLLTQVSGHGFYNTFKLDMRGLLDDPNHLALHLNRYIDAFSPNVREIMERFKFQLQVERMAEKNLLYEVVKRFAATDLSPERVDNVQMGYVFEELIRIGAEQSNEEAGEHYTPREVIRLMVNLLLSQEEDLRTSHVVKTIYDPACGTGGMLAVAEQYIRELNSDAMPIPCGQELNDDAWAVAKSDMLIKGAKAENILLGDTFKNDGFQTDEQGRKWTFDYMLANPPFGVEWKQQRSHIKREAESLGHAGRFGAGLPRISDGSLLFLQHMLSKMRVPEDGGSRIAIVFNGSPLFTGGAGSGESNIRRWIIENDWLEAVVALPDQLFYNTGISTYVWVLTNRKEPRRRGKVQLLDARRFFVKMPKSLGNKRNKIGDPADRADEPNQIREITRIYGDFQDGQTRSFEEEDPVTKEPVRRDSVVCRVFENEDFGFRNIVVDRPLRMNFQASPERIDRLGEAPLFVKLPESSQEKICELVEAFADCHGEGIYRDRAEFLADWRAIVRQTGESLKTMERRAVLEGLGERELDAEICRNSRGEPEPDPALRDSEIVPLRDEVEDWFRREVQPYAPDAWVDHSKTKIGYKIPLVRRFYRYDLPRPLDEIDADIRKLHNGIMALVEEIGIGTLAGSVGGAGRIRSDIVPCGILVDQAASSGDLDRMSLLATVWPDGTPKREWNARPLRYMMRRTDRISAKVDDDVPRRYIGMASVQPMTGALTESAALDWKLPSSSSSGFHKGDVLFGKLRPYLGKSCMPDFEGLCSGEFLVLDGNRDMDNHYLYYVLLSQPMIALANASAVGTKMPRTGWQEMGSIMVPVPPVEEQRAICLYLDDATRGIDALDQQASTLIDRLREKRQALITAAVTGQIDVREEGGNATE